MRVLHVIPSIADVSGGPSRAIALMEGVLSDAGIDVTTITTDDDGSGKRLPAGTMAEKKHGAKRVYFRKWFDFYTIAPGILPWLSRHLQSFDVVHIHALFSFTSVAAALLANQRGVPYVIRPLGTLNRYGMTQRRPWLKSLSLATIEAPILRQAAAVHFTSEAEEEEARALKVSLRSVIIPLAVEPEFAEDSRDLLLEDRFLRNRQVILFLSRLDPKKNVEALIDAFASSGMLRRRALLLVAGGGERAYVESLRSRGLKAGVDDSIVWLGHVEGARKKAVFAAADVFALPSYSENFGIAVAEAMLAGLPVVLSRGVAIAQEVSDAEAGMAVTPDPRGFAEALEQLLINRALRNTMGLRAREFAERQYSTPLMGERLIALYEEIISHRAARQ